MRRAVNDEAAVLASIALCLGLVVVWARLIATL
jgi:phosphate/sulfate permease